MSQRTPDGSAFGFSDITLDEPENDPLSDEYVEPSAEVEAPPEPQEPEEPEPEQETEEEAEEAPEPEPEAPAPEQDALAAAEEAARLYAGRYHTVEQLEKGYGELSAEYTRARQQAVEMEQRQQQLEQVMQQLVPVLEAQLAQQDPEAAERYRQQMELQQQAQAIAEAQVAPLREQMELQAQQSKVESLVNEFRARHPDVAPGTELDRAVVQTASDLQLNAANLESLEIAYEAAKDPYLRQVLKANPPLIESDEGIAYARIQARLLQGLSGQGQPAPQQQPRPAGEAYVETGEGGAPARNAASTPYDEFDEAMDTWAKERRGPLFGS